jgi:HD-like signal output (HDOD) protein
MDTNRVTPEDLVTQTADLVSLPDIYIRLKTVVDDPESSMADVADVVANDPGLTARLLKIANSPYFGFPAKITTVARATSLLGTQQIHDLVLATTVTEAFSGIPSELISMQDFWSNSIRCGLLCRRLAQECNVLDSERLFVEGLLHDVGHLIMYQALPEASAAALLESQQQDKPLFLVERELIGCDYAQVGSALMRSWHFPPGLIESVLHQNEPARAEEFPLEGAIMHIAVRLKEHAIADPKDAGGLPRIDAAAWQVTGLAEEVIEPVCAAAAEQLATTVDMLFPDKRKSA